MYATQYIIIYTTQYIRHIRLIWLKFDSLGNIAAGRQVPWFLARGTDAELGSEHRFAQSSLAPPSTESTELRITTSKALAYHA